MTASDNKKNGIYKSKLEWDAKYQKEKTTIKAIKFINTTDKDILEFIENKKPFATYIKKLIRKDMKETKEK